jgi:hypothetical protein
MRFSSAKAGAAGFVVHDVTQVHRLKRRDPSRDRSFGQSLVEFAIFVPVLALIMLIAVDLGRVYLGWVTLTNVARIGANYAAQNPDAWSGSGNATVQARYRQLMVSDAEGINCALPSTLPGPSFADSSRRVGSNVTVNLSCTFDLFTPMLANLVGDGSGSLDVGASATFTIRFGSFDTGTIDEPDATASPTATATTTTEPTPTATPTPAPTPEITLAPGATPSPTPDPTAAPTPTPQPVVVSFYGTPTSADASGGGPPGSTDENLIVGIPNLSVTFSNTTTGDQGSCLWDFGDGNTATACSNSVSHTYTTRGTYTVTLTVDGQSVTRAGYVLVSCKVPAFAGVRKNSASGVWTSAGFSSSNFSASDGTGNYKIGFQSLAGGLINPPGGCDGATILVGP